MKALILILMMLFSFQGFTQSTTGCVSGDCKDGYGTFVYDNGKYIGYFKNSYRTGYGNYYWNNGDHYVGYWVNDKQNGLGLYTFANGTIWKGDWVDAKFTTAKDKVEGCVSGDCNNGYGTYIWASSTQWAGHKYIGYFKNGNQHGYGTYYFTDGRIWEGQWVDAKFQGNTEEKKSLINTEEKKTTGCISGDCKNGYGTYVFASGEKYEGNWLNDKRNGQGTNNYSNGDVYTGSWLQDQQHGYGTMKFSNGDKYIGYYEYHKRSGIGTCIYKDGSKYVGEWKNSEYEGQGTFYNTDGTTKSGQWKDNEYVGSTNNVSNITNKTGCISGNCTNGYGVYVWETGDKYEGYFEEYKPTGEGTCYFVSGEKYTGKWKNTKRHGYGTNVYKSTSLYDTYTGNYVDDAMDGFGTLRYRSGQKYVGYFKGNEYNGEGTMYYVDGTSKSGIWENSEYVGKTKDNYGCISGNCNDGYGTYVYEGGSKYVGNWKSSKRNGQGTYYHDNGDKYVGDFVNGAYEGQGTYIFSSDNRKYIGSWKNSTQEGYGTMYYSTGETKAGMWKAGAYVGVVENVGKVPVLSWLLPNSYVTTTTAKTYEVKLCVSTSSEVKAVQIFVNEVLQNAETRGFKVVNAGCDYTVNETVKLNDGENRIKITVSNSAGKATSEMRTITVNSGGGLGEKRLALVIGNSSYIKSPLKNPVNDAQSVANELRTLGFDVMLFTNISQVEMKKNIRLFGEKLSAQKGIGLFYFAGHGIQIGGENYIVPVDAQIEKEQDVDIEAVKLKGVLGEMDYAGNDLNIVILDACRNNPFVRSFRSGGSDGLATTIAPRGTFIAYATAPGSVASDGSGANGLYTEELIKAMRVPNARIEDVFKAVRTNVYQKSNKQQVPWENSSIFGDFYFKK